MDCNWLTFRWINIRHSLHACDGGMRDVAEFLSGIVMVIIVGGAVGLFAAGACCIVVSWLAWAWNKLTS